jgi:hypothetical protein
MSDVFYFSASMAKKDFLKRTEIALELVATKRGKKHTDVAKFRGILQLLLIQPYDIRLSTFSEARAGRIRFSTHSEISWDRGALQMLVTLAENWDVYVVAVLPEMDD